MPDLSSHQYYLHDGKKPSSIPKATAVATAQSGTIVSEADYKKAVKCQYSTEVITVISKMPLYGHNPII